MEGGSIERSTEVGAQMTHGRARLTKPTADAERNAGAHGWDPTIAGEDESDCRHASDKRCSRLRTCAGALRIERQTSMPDREWPSAIEPFAKRRSNGSPNSASQRSTISSSPRRRMSSSITVKSSAIRFRKYGRAG